MSKPSWTDRVLDRFGLIKKEAILPEYLLAGEPQPRVPDWNIGTLYETATQSWVLQEIFRTIIQEVKRPGWRIEPKFSVKCENCGTEYPITVAKCEVCSSKNLRKPLLMQRQHALHILSRPNSNRESFGDILGSVIYHDLVADDWYLSVEYARTDGGELVPAEIRVQRPTYVRPILDQYGRLGRSNQWFCPVCWRYEADPVTPPSEQTTEVSDQPGSCPICGLKLQETAYVQEVNGTITSRWGLNQMVHGSTYRVLPGWFGEPRARSLWNIIHVLLYMDQWFIDTFSESRLAKIVNFPGYDQAKLTQLMAQIQADVNTLKILNEQTGDLRTKKSLQMLLLASESEIKVHDVGISPEEIQLLDYYRMCIMAVCGTYGVQAIFISYVEKGKAGTTPAMQIEVQNRTISEIQRDKEEIINQQLFPIFGINDWILLFNPLEKKDRVREAEIEQRTADTALTYRKAGFDVWFDEFDRLHKSSKPTGPLSDREGGRVSGSTPPKHKVSGASEREIEGTTTERKPHGPRPASPSEEEPKQ